MKKKYPLMPKAIAVWMIDNTSLTFKQIAEFCGMHELEVQGIADGENAIGITPINPIVSGQLEKDELERCTQDQNATLQIKENAFYTLVKTNKKYTPLAHRSDKPDAIYWLIKNYPDLKDSVIVKLIGTTKTTIAAIRNRTHWNMQNIRACDPVVLGLCSQKVMNDILEKYQVDNLT